MRGSMPRHDLLRHRAGSPSGIICLGTHLLNYFFSYRNNFCSRSFQKDLVCEGLVRG